MNFGNREKPKRQTEKLEKKKERKKEMYEYIKKNKLRQKKRKLVKNCRRGGGI